MALRISASFILFLSILYMPFWFSILLAMIAVAYFSLFLEAPIIFLMSDFMYGVDSPKYFGFTFVSFTVALLLVFLAEFIKRKIRVNSDTN